jgi:hypothetical protein
MQMRMSPRRRTVQGSAPQRWAGYGRRAAMTTKLGTYCAAGPQGFLAGRNGRLGDFGEHTACLDYLIEIGRKRPVDIGAVRA